MLTTARTLPAGGSYPADQNPDGSWNVRGVPVFAAHRRFGRSFGRAWLDRAVRQAQEDHAAGYIAPLHVAHHGTGEDVLAAGHFMATGIEERVYEGRSVPVVVADFLQVPDEVYQRIRSGRLPYVSVEIGDLSKPQITSLALLEHSAPFFKFPLVTIGDEQPAAAKTLAASAPVLAYQGEHLTLFQFGGSPVKKPAKSTKPARRPAAIYEGDPAAMVGDVLAKVAEAIKTSVAQAIDSALSEFSVAEAEPEMPAEEEVAEESMEEDLAPAEAPPMAAQASTRPLRLTQDRQIAAYAAQSAAMAGRLAALEAKHKAAEARAEGEGVIAAAMAELRTYSVDGAEQQLRQQWAAGGKTAVDAFVTAIKTYGVQAPPESWTGDLPAGAGDAPEVAAYALAGPQKLREARRMSAIYAASPSFVRRTPLADYIAGQIGSPPQQTPAPTGGR